MSKLTPTVSDLDHMQGAPNARITLVKYGDYQCPHCGMAYRIVKNAQKRMGTRLRFVFRNFPLTQAHEFAQLAAEAAEAAGAQGKFWEMHDLLFEHQYALDDRSLLNLAGRLELDIARFNTELQKHIYADVVRRDFTSGVRSGVNGTPTFFINGVRFDDSWDLDTLVEALNEAEFRVSNVDESTNVESGMAAQSRSDRR